MDVRLAKTQISLDIRQLWSEFSLSAWKKLGSFATNWAHSEDSVQTERIPTLIWVFTWRTSVMRWPSYKMFVCLHIQCVVSVFWISNKNVIYRFTLLRFRYLSRIFLFLVFFLSFSLLLFFLPAVLQRRSHFRSFEHNLMQNFLF